MDRKKVIIAITSIFMIIGVIFFANTLFKNQSSEAKKQEVVVESNNQNDESKEEKSTKEDLDKENEKDNETKEEQEKENIEEAKNEEEIKSDDNKEEKNEKVVATSSDKDENKSDKTTSSSNSSSNSDKEQDKDKDDDKDKDKDKEPEKPVEKPEPPKKNTVTIAINCNTAINDNLHKQPGFEHLPSSGSILGTTTVEIEEGETVLDVLKKVTRQKNIHMEYTGSGSSAYIEGIHNLYEFDGGEKSGWMYSVNGWYPNYGAGTYKLKDGDIIKWNYTLDLGKDLGA